MLNIQRTTRRACFLSVLMQTHLRPIRTSQLDCRDADEDTEMQTVPDDLSRLCVYAPTA